eukprot:scaffold14107_cov124-Isochrysis_galbana.AAC.7
MFEREKSDEELQRTLQALQKHFFPPRAGSGSADETRQGHRPHSLTPAWPGHRCWMISSGG